jgi:hypothetical protein
MNSPKLHFLRHKDGRFLNVKDNELRNSFTNASYDKKESVLKTLLQLDKYKDYELFTVTENDYMKEMAQDTTNLIIAGEYFRALLEKVDYNLPTISQVNKNLHTQTKRTIELMKPFAKWHDQLIEEKEDLTDDFMEIYTGFIEEVATVKIHECSEGAMVLHALKLDRDSMIGIAKKVMRNNGVEVKIIK